LRIARDGSHSVETKHQATVASALQRGPGRWEQAQQRLTEVVQRATWFKYFGATQQGSLSKTVPPTNYKVECPQAAGFLRQPFSISSLPNDA